MMLTVGIDVPSLWLMMMVMITAGGELFLFMSEDE